MRIIIIGAGIGGTSAGTALTRLGHQVEIYEQVTENRPVGAALSLWPNGVKALNHLGLGEVTARLGGRMDNMSYRDGRTGDTMCRFSLAPVTEEMGQRPYPVSRAELQAALMEAFGLDRIRFGMRLEGVEQHGDTVTATFANGETATGDMLIGADGARSRIRSYVVGAELERRYAGYVNYNGLVEIDPEVGPADQWTTYVADGQRVSVMPVAGDRFYFFFDVVEPAGLPYDRADARAVLSKHFSGWAPGVQRLIERIDPASTNRVEVFDIDPFHTWVRGRVALLGDSAHNTTPDIGQGACSALEDTIVLERVLATTTLGVEDSLRRYQAARTQRAGDLVMWARKRADVTHAKDPEITQAWYEELRREDGTGVIRGIVGNMVGNPLG
ncbi:FAD-dependent urate hydroxylase HpxO [Kineosporia sp. J2-2]|uniref:FAD-dependent urate hydroxylase n=1 Tax=Kineosporia corallincola TaxID=2835133 RepID=A0ABS5TR42_9ACTN|nr:FAD-dependent urate hydroxylase HpxO [Kineosporia corallincola]MBT0773201.1 FAD-dependent urate hydroxylase HpxO [Kineosporia corallincola]